MRTNSNQTSFQNKHCDVIGIEEKGKEVYQARIVLKSDDKEFAPPALLLKGSPKKIAQILTALGKAYADRSLPEEALESPLSGRITFEVKKNKVVGTSENGEMVLETDIPDEANEEEISSIARSVLSPVKEKPDLPAVVKTEEKQKFPSMASVSQVQTLFLKVRTLWADLNCRPMRTETRNELKVVALHVFVRNLALAKGIDPIRVDDARHDSDIVGSSSLKHLLSLYRNKHFPELSSDLLVLEQCSEIENRMTFRYSPKTAE